MTMLLKPVKLNTPEPTTRGQLDGQDGSTWYVWSDNVDDRTLTCLPYQHRGDDESFIFDLNTFSYDQVQFVPRVLDVVARAARTHQGLIEVAVPSSEYDDVQDACTAGYLQMVANGMAMVTDAGRALANSQ